ESNVALLPRLALSDLSLHHVQRSADGTKVSRSTSLRCEASDERFDCEPGFHHIGKVLSRIDEGLSQVRSNLSRFTVNQIRSGSVSDLNQPPGLQGRQG